MSNLKKRIFALLMVIATLTCLAPAVLANGADDVTILFTHDLHSHLLPALDENGKEYGGYARLMTVIKEQKEKYPDAILVDGGDFSMGSLFQTAYPTSALELRIMGKMGYDATTFGNHEFDYLPKGLTSMLNAAVDSGDPLPAIVNSNYLPPEKGEKGYDSKIWDALNNYGVKDYVIIERGGVPFIIFGIFGSDSDDCAPNSGMIFDDPVKTAKKTVNTAIKECKKSYSVDPVVVCLSHSGTEDGKGEDYTLAEEVDGIDVIISGHTHTTINKPITVNGTHIVSAAEYGKFLGVLRLEKSGDTTKVKKYELISVDGKVEDDPEIAALVESYKADVEENYLSDYGVGFDEIMVNNPYKFDTVDEVYATQHESTLCNVFADAYKWAVEEASGERVDVALTAAGVIRESLPVGDVKVSDIFNAASLGVGTEGELIAVYITGKDLMCALEVDASVQPLMRSAQLFFSGIEYSFNTKRMIFNKVDYAMLRRDDGTLEKIEPDKMYRVVTGMYAGQMLGSVESTSMGLLSITPRDRDGNPIAPDELVNYVVKDENGTPVKEWFAIASYLREMGGEMDEKYSETDGRKVVYSSFNPVKLLRNPNKFTIIALIVVNLLLAGIALAVVLIVRKIRKKRRQETEKAVTDSDSLSV